MRCLICVGILSTKVVHVHYVSEAIHTALRTQAHVARCFLKELDLGDTKVRVMFFFAICSFLIDFIRNIINLLISGYFFVWIRLQVLRNRAEAFLRKNVALD